MFLVDELLKKALEYFARRIESGRAQHDGAIKSIRIAMRALSSSLNEVSLQIGTGLHRLRRLEADRDAYLKELEQIVDSEFLRSACNESGVCRELQVAQDELISIAPANSSDDLRSVRDLADQLEAYESGFVAAVREFLASARQMDLTAGRTRLISVEPRQISDALTERLDALDRVRADIDALLDELRESAYRRNGPGKSRRR